MAAESQVFEPTVAPQDFEGRQSFYLVLDGISSAEAAVSDGPVLKWVFGSASKARARQIERQQAALQSHLNTAGYKVTGRYSRLANAIKIQARPDQLDELKKLPGVKRIESVRLYYRRTSTSVPFIGSKAAWSALSPGVDGSGVRIGFIDSGIDYTHAAFGGAGDPADFLTSDPTLIEPGSFPTAKVVGGFDFAGDSYNAASGDLVAATPLPDPDPIDCNGHGTHVAGIAAGFGVLTNGLTYKGTYTADLDMNQFSVGPGVAPKALLYALKVFGCDGPTDLVLEALEWAADPNGDGDFSDRLDVVNLSLGSSFGTISPDDVVLNAANRLAELGCVVVVAAGNSGNIFYTTGAPGVAERAISVGNSIDSGLTRLAIQVLSPSAIAGRYEAVEGEFTMPLSETGPIVGRVVYANPDRACEDLLNAAELRGNIALIDRGICFFVDKIQRAQDAGARAVIMVNNDDQPPIVMGGTNENITIPGVMISRADGDILKRNLANLRVRLDASIILPGSDRADQLDGSSSRGPSSPGNLLKPEITAPGAGILSAGAGSGNEGAIFSGTSMSSPHVAGAAALLKQVHPDWPVEDIKAALMNTAAPTLNEDGKPYPESQTGAGRVQIDQAIRVQVTAAAENANGLVSLSLGELTLTDRFTTTRRVRINNRSTHSVTYSVSIQHTVSETGFSIVPLTNQVTVPPESAVAFPFRITAEPSLFDRTGDDLTPTRLNGQPRHMVFEASGRIQFHSEQHSLQLPYYAILRAASDQVTPLTHAAVSSRSNLVTVTVPMSGVSAHPAPLVSAFQLGAVSPNQHLSDPIFAAADLLAVGAATDAVAQRSVDNSTVYFGIATAEPWTTPQSFLIDLQVLIDADRDGVVDFVLSNANDGALAANNLFNPDVANDVFLTVVRDLLTGELTSGGFVNIFPANQRDTAPFNNSVIVLSVPARTLGLSAGNSKLNYRVIARGPDSERLIDQTSWIRFDAEKPAIDTATFGIEGYPMHSAAAPIKVQVDRAASIAGGFGSADAPELLLLHHFNRMENRFQIVRLDLGPVDTDHDGLPDEWETNHFGKLGTADDRTDFDRDGFSDAREFAAGTDPTDRDAALKIVSVTSANPSGLVVRWSSVNGKFYMLERATNLVDGFFAIEPPIAATPPLNSHADKSATGSGPFYYRVRVLPD